MDFTHCLFIKKKKNTVKTEISGPYRLTESPRPKSLSPPQISKAIIALTVPPEKFYYTDDELLLMFRVLLLKPYYHSGFSLSNRIQNRPIKVL